MVFDGVSIIAGRLGRFLDISLDDRSVRLERLDQGILSLDDTVQQPVNREEESSAASGNTISATATPSIFMTSSSIGELEDDVDDGGGVDGRIAAFRRTKLDRARCGDRILIQPVSQSPNRTKHASFARRCEQHFE